MPRLSLQLFNSHELLLFGLSHVDGQVRSRTESYYFGSGEKLGEASLKRCFQMYYSLALITKGRVRTLVRSVDESNGAEARRLVHSKYAPGTQHRQYVLMQKIMKPVKPWCDQTEVFESGLRAWELVVRDWERASGNALANKVKYTVMMNMTPIFLRNNCRLAHLQTVQFFEPHCCHGVTPATWEHPRAHQQEMEQALMTTRFKSTLSRGARVKGKNT